MRHATPKRHRIRSVRFNFVMNMVLTASSLLFPLITTPYISRVLQPAGSGQLAFALSVVSYFMMFASLGIPTYGIRACARVRDDRRQLSRTVHELLIINAVATACMLALFLLSLVVVAKFRMSRDLLLIDGVSLVLNAISVNWFYSALEQYSFITVRSLILRGAALVLMFLFVKGTGDILVYAGITVFSASGANIISFIHMRKLMIWRPFHHYQFKRHLKPVFVFMGAAVATSVYTNLDTVLLGFMQNETQVGYYQIGVKVKLAAVALVTSLSYVLIPRLSYYIKKDNRRAFDQTVGTAFSVVFIMASAMMVYFIVFSRETALALGGPLFFGAILPMKLMMPSILFIGITYVTGLQILTPLGMENKMLFSYLCAAVINLAANFLLIPRYQAAGAAFSASLAEFCVLLVQGFFCFPVLKTVLRQLPLLKMIGSLAVAAGFLVGIKYFFVTVAYLSHYVMLIISALLFFAVYFALLFAVKEPFIRSVAASAFRFLRRRGQREPETL